MSSRVMWPAWAELTERVWRPSLRVVIISGVLLCSAYLAPRMPRQLMALAVLIWRSSPFSPASMTGKRM